jgi:SPP1 gp7 family putative phage head morphogenesis protein
MVLASLSNFNSRLNTPRKPPRVKKPPIQLFPRNAQQSYTRELDALVTTMTDLTKTLLFSRLPDIVSQAKILRPVTDSLHQDDFTDEISRIINRIKSELSARFGEENYRQAALAAGVSVAQFNKKEVLKVIRALGGIDVFMAEPYLESEMAAFVKQNVSLIKSVPDRYFTEVEEIVFRGARQGLSNTEIKKEVTARFDVSKNRAKFIARDQVGKFNGQLTQLRQQSVGIKEYIWRNSLDERVRGNPKGLYPKVKHSHWTREGKRYKWSKAPVDGHPGEAPGCRCTAEPVLPDNTLL